MTTYTDPIGALADPCICLGPWDGREKPATTLQRAHETGADGCLYIAKPADECGVCGRSGAESRPRCSFTRAAGPCSCWSGRPC
jgi:hypothetical protein